MRPSWAIIASCGVCVGLAGACDDETETSATGAPTGTTSAGSTTSTGSGAGTTPAGQGTTSSGQGASTSQGGNSGQGGNGTGGCITCVDVWNGDADPANLCTDDGSPSADALFEAVKTCACDGTCSQCANSLCQDANPSGSCQGCVASDCTAAFNACLGI